MTAHELANHLLVGPDLPVTIRGYEGGVEIIDHIAAPAPIHLNVNSEWYYGEHEYHDTTLGSCSHCSLDESAPSEPTDLAINLSK